MPSKGQLHVTREALLFGAPLIPVMHLFLELRKNYSLFPESHVYSYGAEVGNEGNIENWGESRHYELLACQ